MSKSENKSGKCKKCSNTHDGGCNKKPEMNKKDCDKQNPHPPHHNSCAGVIFKIWYGNPRVRHLYLWTQQHYTLGLQI